MKYTEIEEFIGKTFAAITATKQEVRFITTEGEQYLMHHVQDCCESVEVEDIVGDLNDLIGLPMLLAEEATSAEGPKEQYDESFTWTFYKFGTIKGYVTIRWYGVSNGYYSESVDLVKVS